MNMEKRTALKRRGILAAAGAVVAGIVAKQAAEPVSAAFNLQADADNESPDKSRDARLHKNEERQHQ